MRKTSAWMVCALAAASLANADRAGSIGFGIVTFEGVTVRYEAVLEPPLKDSDVFLLGSGVKPEGNGMHRYLVDGTTHTYFGYDLVVGSTVGHGRHLVTIEPLNISEKDLRVFGSEVPLKPALLPKYPAPQVVQDGDTIAIDLLVSPDGRQKLVDYIRVESQADRARATAAKTLFARDFTLDDGALNFQVLNPPKLSINGQEFRDPIGWHMEAGSTMWLAIPGRGTYILSLTPRGGYRFQKAGSVRDRAIEFQVDGDRFELRTSGPLAGAGQVWNLYVLHQPSREMKGPLLGVGRLETLVR